MLGTGGELCPKVVKTTSHRQKRVHGLPYHVYSTAELGVKQQRLGNGLPQVVAGYNPDPIQTTLIQSVAQQLVESEMERGDIHTSHRLDVCCQHVKILTSICTETEL